MMENRSFDHFLGWLPTANGKQAGLSYADQAGSLHSTYHLAGDFTGCGHVQPDHSYQGGRIEYDKGKMDGILRSGSDTYAIGYYQEEDLGFFGALMSRSLKGPGAVFLQLPPPSNGTRARTFFAALA